MYMDGVGEDHFARRARERQRYQHQKEENEGEQQEEGKPKQRAFGEVPSAPQHGFGKEVDIAFQEVFSGPHATPRVLDSFRRLCAGVEHVQVWPGKGQQRAGSFMDGLTAEPFPDVYSGAYPWLENIERQYGEIQEEFQTAMQDPDSLFVKGNRIWAKAALKDAVAYGPNWRTLVLQDRGVWDEYNAKVFPKTKEILTRLKGMVAVLLSCWRYYSCGGGGILMVLPCIYIYIYMILNNVIPYSCIRTNTCSPNTGSLLCTTRWRHWYQTTH